MKFKNYKKKSIKEKAMYQISQLIFQKSLKNQIYLIKSEKRNQNYYYQKYFINLTQQDKKGFKTQLTTITNEIT